MSSNSPTLDTPISVEGQYQTCDSPSGSSTSEPHDDSTTHFHSYMDNTFLSKIDPLTSEDQLFFTQQGMEMDVSNPFRNDVELKSASSPSLTAQPASPSQPTSLSTSVVEPLQPASGTTNQTFWSGFNNFFANVAQNPFPQAIPNLARNVTDYLTSYPPQPSNPGDMMTTTRESSVPLNDNAPNLTGMEIKVLGVPQSGAKSRVETQIKLCIQLVTGNGDKAQWWSHLKLPEQMVARDKLRRQIVISSTANGQKTTTITGIDGASVPIHPEKMLYLKARVLCASDPSKKVTTCLGCIQRERKRSQRRKDSKAKIELEDDKRTPEDERFQSPEEQKVLLFNCSEVVDFSSGDTILPTRITCYCRHHNERIGFRIAFEMHDHTGRTIAAGSSPPIMITDDHKSNKVGRKRPRKDSDTNMAPTIASANSLGLPTTPYYLPVSAPLVQPPMLASYRGDAHAQSPLHSPFPDMPVVPTTAKQPLHSPVPRLSMEKDMFSTMDLSPNPIFNLGEVPQLQRLIPNEGPTYGGIEVTILGSGFRQGLTCMFGDMAASSTQCWSPNTLVCILPSAAQPGPVVVSFKECPPTTNEDILFFKYYNENDRALMELALQVVGLKMTGKVEDAREIAMRIVQGNNNNSGSSNEAMHVDGSGHQQLYLEQHIIQVLQVMETAGDIRPEDVSLVNAQRHSMLHLSSMLGFTNLVRTLITLQCDANVVDRNGNTALHYASAYGREAIVKLLLDEGANVHVYNHWHQTAVDVAEQDGIRALIYASTDLSSTAEDTDTSTLDARGGDESDLDCSDSDISWSDNSDASDETDIPLLPMPHTEGMRHRRRPQPALESIQYLGEEDDQSPSADEIPDAETVHRPKMVFSSDEENERIKKRETKSKSDMSFLQNIKNISKAPDINFRAITDQLAQLPRPAAAMIANLSFRFNNDHPPRDVAGAEQDLELSRSVALLYALTTRLAMTDPSRTKSKEAHDTMDTASAAYDPDTTMGSASTVVVKKRNDRRLFVFWVPLLCVMLLWFLFQCFTSHDGVLDGVLTLTGLRSLYQRVF